MRPSPTKVVFRYPTVKDEPPLYSPQLIHSGYIIGQPVAYTEHPQLPPNFSSFSPKRQRAITTNPLNQSVRINRESFESKYEAPDPSIFAPPQRQSFRDSASRRTDNVSIEEYNALKQRYVDLQRKYQLLQGKYERLKTDKEETINRGFSGESMARVMTRLIETYQQNTIKECHLLVDRLRLENKQAQLDSNRQF